MVQNKKTKPTPNPVIKDLVNNFQNNALATGIFNAILTVQAVKSNK